MNRLTTATATAAILLLFTTVPTFAADSMHAAMMMKPSCATGDPVVGVDSKSKTYMSHDQMKTKMAGTSDSQMQAMMMKQHVTMMCRSKAMAMGAKMMPSKM